MPQKPSLCLTFDLEEFDLPLEYNQNIELEEQIAISEKGTQNIIPLLKKYHAQCTFFVTANFALHKKELVQQLSSLHEIASHNYYHSSHMDDELKKSKQVLEEIIQKPVTGFRTPRMGNANYGLLKEAGYLYDSSLNPTYLPGRYNHIASSKKIFKQDDLIIFPATVTPTFRIPLFWLTFKNMPVNWYCRQVEKCLNTYGYANIYLHPWEFTTVKGFKISGYLLKNEELMLNKIEYLLDYFKDKAELLNLQEVLKKRNEL